MTVPAGTFDAFRVQISFEGGGPKAIVWIAKESHQAVKIMTGSPAGATMTSELLP